MNKAGKAFIESVNKRFSPYKQEFTQSLTWENSKTQERLMRLGREIRLYQIELDDVASLESVAIASIREDFLNQKFKTYDVTEG